MPGWWLKVIFQGGQGGGAYLGEEWGWERGLTRGGTTTTTTSNAPPLPIHVTIGDQRSPERSAIAKNISDQRSRRTVQSRLCLYDPDAMITHFPVILQNAKMSLPLHSCLDTLMLQHLLRPLHNPKKCNPSNCFALRIQCVQLLSRARSERASPLWGANIRSEQIRHIHIHTLTKSLARDMIFTL